MEHPLTPSNLATECENAVRNLEPQQGSLEDSASHTSAQQMPTQYAANGADSATFSSPASDSYFPQSSTCTTTLLAPPVEQDDDASPKSMVEHHEIELRGECAEFPCQDPGQAAADTIASSHADISGEQPSFSACGSGEQPTPLVDAADSGEQPMPLVDAADSVQQPMPFVDTTDSGEQPMPLVDAADSVQQPMPLVDAADSGEQPMPLVDAADSVQRGMPCVGDPHDMEAFPADGSSAEVHAPSTQGVEPRPPPDRQPIGDRWVSSQPAVDGKPPGLVHLAMATKAIQSTGINSSEPGASSPFQWSPRAALHQAWAPPIAAVDPHAAPQPQSAWESASAAPAQTPEDGGHAKGGAQPIDTRIGNVSSIEPGGSGCGEASGVDDGANQEEMAGALDTPMDVPGGEEAAEPVIEKPMYAELV
jgi:hypothetical protein